MKKIIVGIVCVVIVIAFLFIIKIPKYIELNNLIIIEGVGVECKGQNYTIYLREIIPMKDDTGISYKYKFYTSDEADSIDKAYNDIIDKSGKKIFYDDTKYLITNCSKSDKIIDYFDIKPDYIEHTKNDIKKVLKKK